MEAPKIITALIASQNEHNSNAFADLFTEQAIVDDENKTYIGKAEIKQWNIDTNNKYKTRLEFKEYTHTEDKDILTVLVSGNFPGSPIMMDYHLHFEKDKISKLLIK